MADIRINDLPTEATPNVGDFVPIDGATTRKTTIVNLVNSARPFASQAEAEAGASTTKGMSPLTAAQAIAAQGAVLFGTAAQGVLADTAVQPAELDAVKVPAGGTTGQVLGKVDNTDNNVAWQNTGAGDLLAVNNLLDVASASAARTNLGLAIGVNVQAYDADLTAWAGLNPSAYLNTAGIAAAYQPLDADLTAISALTTTAYGRGFLDLANDAALTSRVDGSGAVMNADTTTAPMGFVIDEDSMASNLATKVPTQQSVKAYVDATASVVVATRTALKAIDTTVTTAAILKEAGREGQFVWKTGDYSTQIAADTAEGVYVKATAVASTVGAWARVFDCLSAGFFGASPALADNSSALQAALDFSDAHILPLHIPAGYYNYATTLTKKQLTNIIGAGMLVTRLIYSGAGDGLTIKPDAAASDKRAFWKVHDLSIEPVVLNAGMAGLRLLLDTAGTYFSNFEIAYCRFGEFGNGGSTQGGLVLDNSAALGDGIFCGTIRRNWINNGLKLRNAGDSLTIEENTIPGIGTGIFATLVSGARQLVIRDNNITTLGINVYLSGVTGAHILNNWNETPAYLGSFTGGAGAGLMYIENSPDTIIKGNTLQTLHGYGGGFVAADYKIAVVGTSDRCIIDENEFGSGSLVADIFRDTATDLTIGRRNRIIGTQRDLVITGGDTLTTYDELIGSFTGTLTGCTTSPTGTINYVRRGKTVHLSIPTMLATSNTTAATITGMPAVIRPSANRTLLMRTTDVGAAACAIGTIGTTGVITLYKDPAAGAFTNSSTKGINSNEIIYQL